jgi:sec-independent protein translocase protein TatA
MFGLGTQELLIIMVLVMIVFGAGKLPQVGSSLGKGLRNFKKGLSEAEELEMAADSQPRDSEKQG